MATSQIVIGYDFTPASDLALHYAVEFACRDPEQILHFVVVLKESESWETADQIRDDLHAVLAEVFRMRDAPENVAFHVHTRIGDAANELVETAEELGADLLVIGSHNRSRVERLFVGSVAEKVLHNARCPVFIARRKEYGHVELDKVIDVVPTGMHRPRAHTYSYSSDIAQVRPNEWPIS
jgi:nucleotide-binding universal stress UspA family protein